MTFSDIYGHERQLAILRRAMAEGRIAHAYLFYGMEGVGKRTVAALFARALNCTGADPPCGRCPSCRKAERRTHPDIVTVAPEGQFIKIGAVKEIQQEMLFRPREGRYRVFIITEADRLNEAAANALLKTLEEPRPGNVLILTTARPHALPMTILSRCQRLAFSPLSQTEVSRYLTEREGLQKDAAQILAGACQGSIGRALEMGRQDFLALRNQILGMLSCEDWHDVLRRLSFATLLGDDREEILERLSIVQLCYRDALLFKATGQQKGLLFGDRLEVIRRLSRLSGRKLLDHLACIEAAQKAITLNVNKTLTLEVMLINLQ